MTARRWARAAPVFAPALLILVGVALRAANLTVYRFHVDEALYATHAREVAAGGDPLLLAFAVDKPPLGVYVTAAAFALLGVSEFAARVPNVLASALSLAALWALARSLYHDAHEDAKIADRRPGAQIVVAGFALLLVALSPYDVLFAPTVFAEPQVTLWILLAGWAATRDRWGWAGVLLALALATKQSALFYFPLVAALGLICNAGAGWRGLARRAVRLALPLLIGLGLLAAWDAPRGPAGSFWALGYAHNAPDRWVRAAEVAPRLEAWVAWLRTFTGADALSLALLALAVAGVAWSVRTRPGRRETVIDLALAGFTLAVLGVLWLSAFNTYDRYVHTLLPLLALLAARGVALVVDLPQRMNHRGPERAETETQKLPKLGGSALSTSEPLRESGGRGADKSSRHLWRGDIGVRSFIIALAIVGGMSAPLSAALAGEIPVGGDKGGHDGIDATAAFLNRLPEGTRVCDHWLGWELGFYLGGETPVRLTWLPRPDALAASAPCYLPAPADAPIARWRTAAARAGFSAGVVFEARDRWGARSFVVYAVR